MRLASHRLFHSPLAQPVNLPVNGIAQGTAIGLWKTVGINSSAPSAACMRQWIGLALVQIMACRPFGAKLSSKPMLGYCQLDPSEQTSVKFQSKYQTLHSQKCIWIYRLRNGGHFVQGEMSPWCIAIYLEFIGPIGYPQSILRQAESHTRWHQQVVTYTVSHTPMQFHNQHGWDCVSV